MNKSPPSSHSTIIEPGKSKSWWLDPALARLAFGSRQQRRSGAAVTGVAAHLAFLPTESLEIDLSDPQQRAFGDYELLELIGQGGMGVVYRARQASLDREVAVKLLSAGPWASADFIGRFQREAQSAARMQHPNIVAIHEIGAHEELNFFSMQLVCGGSLAQQLAEHGPMPPRDAARLLRTIAEAVDYAHRLDVLHLDLKPGNILLDAHGDPQVADFGLAKRLDETLAADSNEVSGTPSYMAPEQAQLRSHKLSPATDIYGLGAILYECLAGKPPFNSSSAQETLQMVISAPAEPLRKLKSELPVDLEAICHKCLSKEPGARYRSARELADDLSRFLEGREVRARPLNVAQRVLRAAHREPKFTALLALLFFSLLLGIGVSSLQWKRAESNAQVSQRLVWDGRREAALRLEQDGNGFEALPRLLSNLAEQERDGKTASARLERRRIGLLVGQGATLIDRFSIADANPMAAEISPDGSLLALSFNDLTVRWYDTATLSERGRVSLSDRSNASGQRVPVMLLRFVDKHRLRATFEWLSNYVSPDDGDSWLIDLDHARLVEPPAAFAHFADASYSSDGRTAVLRNRQWETQVWQVDPWRPMSRLTPAEHDFLPWLVDPRARFAVSLGTAMRRVTFYELPDLSKSYPVAFPGNAGISAWALSGDGRTLALGDFEGRVFLLDTRTRALRTLPTARGREITWISFSEDDAWLASASFDGVVLAFDVASGDSLIAGGMSHEFALRRVGLSRGKRLLIAEGDGRTALWRLPLPGPRAVPAQRIGFAPAPHGSVGGYYPIGWSLEAGLLASAGLDGQIRLWRLPLSPLVPALAAPQVPDQTYFDGRSLVDVAWNQLRIVSPTGTALSAWIKLPQPPGFAELLDRGRLLVATTGPQLRIYDAKTLQLRVPVIALGDSPERLLANADGTRVLLSFGGTGPDGFQQRLQLYNARTGMRLPGEAVLHGPLRHLEFSADSARILVVGPADGSTIVLASTGLRRIGEFAHDPDEPVKWASFSGPAADVALVTAAVDVRSGGDTALVWNPAENRVLSKHGTDQAHPIGVIAIPAGTFVAGSGHDLLIDGSVSGKTVDRLARSTPLAVLALSPDRHLLARAFRREVQLYDADSAVAIGPPLQSDSNPVDLISQLAFSPAGDRLLGRTKDGQWLLWPVAAERRTAAELSAQWTRLSLASEHQKTLYMPALAERSALRARDPGPWQAPDKRPTPTAAASTKPGVVIPARTSPASPLLLDLASNYDQAPDGVRNTYYNVRPTMRPFPVGMLRIGGVDFDVRGMMQVGGVNQFGEMDSVTKISCLALPPVPAAALRFLLTVSLSTPVATGQPVAMVTLHYRDGGQASLPIRVGQEVRGYAGNDLAVPLAFSPDAVLSLFGLEDEVFSAPRLPNPFPQRLVRCMDLETTTAFWPLLLMAISVEPGIPLQPASATVIPGSGSGTKMQQGLQSAHAATTPQDHSRISP